MVTATVRVKNAKGQLIFSKTWETKDPELAANKFTKMYPECWVNVNTDDNKTYIANQPLNMKKDQALVDSGKLSIGKFMTKWYGKQAPKKVVQQELIDEFGEEELV